MKLGARCGAGIDGTVGDLTVQVKATGTGRGPAFCCVETKADHLLFFRLDLDACEGVAEFNGPENVVRPFLPPSWAGQRTVSLTKMRQANAEVPEGYRLRMAASRT